MNSRTSWPELENILRERVGDFSYDDLTKRRRSGMTRFQEWLRSHGIREGRDDREGYVTLAHPAAWARHEAPPQLLLVPQELAIKIETLGHIP